MTVFHFNSWWRQLIVGALLSFVGALPLSAAASEGVLTIPYAGPLSGPIATYGLENSHGHIIAADEINARGGLKKGPWKGYKIEIETYDDRGSSQEAANIAQQLSSNPDVYVIFGHVFSSNCLAALPIYNQAGLPMVTSVCSNVDITRQDYDVAIRLQENDKLNNYAQVDYAVDSLDAEKLGILYMNNDYGTGAMELAIARAEERGVEYIVEPYQGGQTDFKAIIAKLDRAEVDLILHLGFYQEAALFRKQAVQVGLEADMLGSPALISQELIRLGGDAMDGVYVMDFMTEQMMEQDPRIKEIAAQMQERWDESFTYYVRNGYDAMRFVAAGLEAASERSRDAVNEALHDVKIESLTGHPIKVDETGELIVPMEELMTHYSLKVVRDGKFVDLNGQ